MPGLKLIHINKWGPSSLALINWEILASVASRQIKQNHENGPTRLPTDDAYLREGSRSRYSSSTELFGANQCRFIVSWTLGNKVQRNSHSCPSPKCVWKCCRLNAVYFETNETKWPHNLPQFRGSTQSTSTPLSMTIAWRELHRTSCATTSAVLATVNVCVAAASQHLLTQSILWKARRSSFKVARHGCTKEFPSGLKTSLHASRAGGWVSSVQVPIAAT